jgi:hypothetical protein
MRDIGLSGFSGANIEKGAFPASTAFKNLPVFKLSETTIIKRSTNDRVKLLQPSRPGKTAGKTSG